MAQPNSDPDVRLEQVAVLLAQEEEALASVPVDRASAMGAEALQYSTLLPDFKTFEQEVQQREEAQDLFLLSLVL